MDFMLALTLPTTQEIPNQLKAFSRCSHIHQCYPSQVYREMSFTLSVLLLQLLSVSHSVSASVLDASTGNSTVYRNRLKGSTISSLSLSFSAAHYCFKPDAVSTFILLDVIQKYTLRSGSIELIGQVPNVLVESVMWTRNKDKVADWDKGDMTPTYYPTLDKTELNMDTWALTLSDLQPTCNGQYALQINGIETASSFQLIVLESVSGPNISPNCDLRSCNLTCQGAGIDHTEYSWTDNRGRNERGSVLKVEKTKALDRVYTCNFSNPVSWKTSSVRERELFPPENTDANLHIILGSIVGSILGGAVLIIIAAATGIAVYKKRNEANGEEETRRAQLSQQPLQQQPLQQAIQMSPIKNHTQDGEGDGEDKQHETQKLLSAPEGNRPNGEDAQDGPEPASADEEDCI
ncbi:uncharacterized protein LOC121700756 isoform X1 [Alosa sapidissima]|uniref:uncharacterized protein LOC121700756 isoform X1 n=1 Tax=Alosa sapidissima TaxID=34773 RepID=UPI001C08A7E6|nr:uncharacterized protein LOC121700756 isoform X1 [Alosa sapidissima]XP_041939907.1 uncharacterized protein LOC121700756 isoform X1 [Alosa sapidissima]